MNGPQAGGGGEEPKQLDAKKLAGLRTFAGAVVVLIVVNFVIAGAVAIFGGNSDQDPVGRWVGVGFLLCLNVFLVWVQVRIRRSDAWRLATSDRSARRG
ncbi:hypothetical protein ACFP63_01165 [Oerskovia jenensis]|uniref:Protein-S-isoprenylcysteine O-methyltransferase Ste14 n=1 Tax=Oerskovia jenensis TaxID=162169 RepID=A0ABS2LG78_9CELL|nr:hypothetical protein [Oerskovia jenensis]MBM7479119.1 protein-S-isoprenylcysteine O-methyltransferase Ste14 [Oerskovia jenensis]